MIDSRYLVICAKSQRLLHTPLFLGLSASCSGSNCGEKEDSNIDYFPNIVLKEYAKECMDTELATLRDKIISGCVYDKCKTARSYQYPPHWIPKYAKCYQWKDTRTIEDDCLCSI
ncbi:hypothetical protein ACFLTJ_02515 [Chloroflexota bacterium]